MSKKFKNFDEQLKKVINLRKIGRTREAIAEELGITVSKARKLIAQGELVSQNVPQLVLDTNDPIFRTQILRKLKRPVTIQVLAETMHCSMEEIEYTLNDLKDHGYIIEQKGSSFSLGKAPRGMNTKISMNNHLYTDEMKFGVIADMHMCSTAERLDVMNAAYDEFERQGITTVLCPGNYIDGEARFNKHELNTHGLAGQAQYAIDNWPKKPGMKTYYVDGDDHEGWYSKDVGLEFGRYLMLEAQAQGRDDLIYMGYMEADIEVKAPKGSAVIKVIHGGGGSSYAFSYISQKLVECVPLDSEILTKTGWKKHDQIKVGDLVLGFNKDTNKNEWTKITAINKYEDQLVRQYKNDNFVFTCTPNHKWAIEWDKRGSSYKDIKYEYEPQRHLWTLDEAKDRSRIIQAAHSPDGPGLKFEQHGDILNKKDAVEIVMKMTSLQRQSFIYGFMVGEGTKVHREDTNQLPTLMASQNPGPVHDAFVLACALEGKAVSVKENWKECEDGPHQCNRMTVLSKNKRMVNSIKQQNEFKTDVWCPTTELGTWVMKQGNVVTITGNSFQGGEKPSILIIGHYHKQEYCYPRNVHCVQAGTTQDQTTFMRKKRLAAHLGFCVIKFQQDIDGSVTRFCPEFFPFFDKKYYFNRDGAGKRIANSNKAKK